VTEEPTATAPDQWAPQGPAGETQTDPWDDPRLPWSGKPRRIDILLWAGITLSGIYYLVLLPFRASLVGTHPVLLEVLNGSTEAIVSAAAFARVGHGSLTVVVLAAGAPLGPEVHLAGRRGRAVPAAAHRDRVRGGRLGRDELGDVPRA
jgi:hypothetical protein